MWVWVSEIGLGLQCEAAGPDRIGVGLPPEPLFSAAREHTLGQGSSARKKGRKP